MSFLISRYLNKENVEVLDFLASRGREGSYSTMRRVMLMCFLSDIIDERVHVVTSMGPMRGEEYQHTRLRFMNGGKLVNNLSVEWSFKVPVSLMSDNNRDLFPLFSVYCNDAYYTGDLIEHFNDGTLPSWVIAAEKSLDKWNVEDFRYVRAAEMFNI